MTESPYEFLVSQLTNGSNQFLQGGLILGLIGGGIAYLRSLPRRLWRWFLYYGTVTLTVESKDGTFDQLLHWLESQPYTAKTRRLMLRNVRQPGGAWKPTLVPAHGNHVFWWRGRPMWLVRQKEGQNGAPASADAMLAALSSLETINLRTVGRSQQVLKTIVAEAAEAYKVDNEGKLFLFTKSDNYTPSWTSEPLNPRLMSTVYLPDSAKDLVKDAKQFLTMRDWYTQRGVPFRRGYLFEGPPGSGKSITALALAGELKLNLYLLNLATMLTDSSLISFVARIDTSKPCILLIEDIDTSVPNRELNKQTKPFSLGTLLNTLDGVNARENLIVIMTSNHADKLDPALIRPGRVDRRFTFDYATDQQIAQAVRTFFPDKADDVVAIASTWPRPITMAQVQENLRSL